jgi:pyridoxine 4-dehydrogenase
MGTGAAPGHREMGTIAGGALSFSVNGRSRSVQRFPLGDRMRQSRGVRSVATAAAARGAVASEPATDVCPDQGYAVSRSSLRCREWTCVFLATPLASHYSKGEEQFDVKSSSLERGKHMQNHKSGVQRNQVLAKRSGEFLIGDDLRVTRLGFGAMRITGDGIWGEPADRTEAVRVLRRAVELGINFIDTADSYGPGVSEEIIAEALHPYPAGLVIATKGGFVRPGPNQSVENGKPEHLRSACEGSLRRLRLDRLDLYQLHRIDPKVPAEDQLGTLRDLQAQGKIKHIGLSEVGVRQIQHARTIVPIVSVQNRYSVTDRGSEDVLEYCEKEKMGFIPWFPLVAGRISASETPISRIAARWKATPSQVALAWLLAQSPVILPIPGTSRVEHLEENVAAAELEIDANRMKELDRMARGS